MVDVRVIKPAHWPPVGRNLDNTVPAVPQIRPELMQVVGLRIVTRDSNDGDGLLNGPRGRDRMGPDCLRVGRRWRWSPRPAAALAAGPLSALLRMLVDELAAQCRESLVLVQQGLRDASEHPLQLQVHAGD